MEKTSTSSSQKSHIAVLMDMLLRPSKSVRALLIIGLALSGFAAYIDYNQAQDKRLAQIARELKNIKGTIEIRLQQYVTVTQSLEAYVQANQALFAGTDSQKQEFGRQFLVFAQTLESDIPSAMSLQLAPAGIVTYVTQMERNSGAVGFDLLQNPQQREPIFSANRQRSIVVAGPLTLVQGGEGLIIRKAIFSAENGFNLNELYRSGRAQETDAWPNAIANDFWGFATLVISLDHLYQDLQLLALPTAYRYALRGRNGNGAEGDIFWGDQDVFVGADIGETIALPEGSWVLAMKSIELPLLFRTALIFFVGTLLTLIASFLYNANKERLKAQAESEASGRFLAAMSHEIRTPMNGIIGVAQLLEKTSLDEKQKNLLDKILANSQLLLRLVNDLLDFSKIDAGAMRIDSYAYSPKKMIERVVNLFELQASEKNLALNVQYATALPNALQGDEVRVAQILLNLLGNAVKFTQKGSVTLIIESKSEQQKETLRFRVIDTGIGMSNKELKLLFLPFSQANSTITRHHGGTGLGLVISRQLATQMGGEISVKSRVGQGSEFCFSLPIEIASEVIDSEVEASNVLQTPLQTSAVKVLVVDDTKMNTDVVTMLLEDMNYFADSVDSGSKAIEAFKDKNYDVIFMDRQMPGMDGLEATQKLRRISGSASKPWIIAMTASAQEDEKQEYLSSGANDFIAKPVDIKDLHERMRAFQRQGESEGSA